MSEDKKTLFIEDKEVEFTNEPNLLEVIRKNLRLKNTPLKYSPEGVTIIIALFNVKYNIM